MPITYDLERKGDMVVITAHGGYDGLDDVVAYVHSFVGDLNRLQPELALFDHRELTGELDVIDNVSVVTDYAEAIAGLKQVKIAVLTTPERISSIIFLETIAQNVGVLGMAFDDEEQALEWLRG